MNRNAEDFARLFDSLDGFMPNYFRFINPILHRLDTGEFTLGENQLKVLTALSFRENLSPVEISRLFLIPKTSLTTVIRSLEELGLIEKSPTESDRRKFQLRLTDRAGELFREKKKKNIAAPADLFSHISDEKFAGMINGPAVMGEYFTRIGVTL
jgi:MarR family transcriptional regulator, organic hydroperoxide resistance regulator